MIPFKVKNLKVGMVLAEDVKDINGRILLKSGMEITEKHLKILKSWGITEVDVQDVKVEDIENTDSENLKSDILAKAEKEVLRIFRHMDLSHPAAGELFNLCVLRKAKSISNKKE